MDIKLLQRDTDSDVYGYDRQSYFERNGNIAKQITKIIGFINKDQYKSGAWNTIKQFIEYGGHKKDVLVIDEKGRKWDKNLMPNWFKELK